MTIFLVKLVYGINTDMMVHCIKAKNLDQLDQIWQSRKAHAVVGVGVTKSKAGKPTLSGP